jgi:hypothetical protein
MRGSVLSLRTQSGLQQRIVKLRLNRLNSKSPTRLVTPLFHNNELLSKPQDPSVELPFKGALTLRVEAKLRNSDLTRPTKRGTPAAAKNTPPTPPLGMPANLQYHHPQMQAGNRVAPLDTSNVEIYSTNRLNEKLSPTRCQREPRPWERSTELWMISIRFWSRHTFKKPLHFKK